MVMFQKGRPGFMNHGKKTVIAKMTAVIQIRDADFQVHMKRIMFSRTEFDSGHSISFCVWMTGAS
jgi:hypothetical protein